MLVRVSPFLRLGGAALFLSLIFAYAYLHFGDRGGGTLLIIAAVVGGYMALNIGANDVANNIGPAVGSKAMTLTTAVVIAAIFEASGALVAGGDVVGTIKKGIIDPGLIADSQTFVWLMLAALMAAALWLNLATYLGAPVSTTHSIVGGVLGAGIAAGGWQIANWHKMATIAASWVISPVLGGLIAASLLYLIKRTILYQDSMMEAARRNVPLFVSLMAWAFGTYLMLKGLKKIWKVDFATASLTGLAIAIVTYMFVRPLVDRVQNIRDATREDVNKLFAIPLIFAAALLSFAHGANDVANAVGPLAAINDALASGAIAKKAVIPLWIMAIGAFGLAAGLALYGPKLIKTVGSGITHLDMIRAYCIALAAAITVIIASQLGLPVSSTHIAVGAVFGVGFLREYLEASHARRINQIRQLHHDAPEKEVVVFLDAY
ncbi:MAG TPA: inorganic phosphate transporter, partial [Rhizobiales bacterium]|nr:inorganic phosphate transporter [Hyphomicrobiales bacterium]